MVGTDRHSIQIFRFWSETVDTLDPGVPERSEIHFSRLALATQRQKLLWCLMAEAAFSGAWHLSIWHQVEQVLQQAASNLLNQVLLFLIIQPEIQLLTLKRDISSHLRAECAMLDQCHSAVRNFFSATALSVASLEMPMNRLLKVN